MKIESFKKLNENYLAVAVTCVLFFLLFLVKVQENYSSTNQNVIVSSEEVFSKNNPLN